MNLKTQIRPDLWQAVANTYTAENYSHAILDAMHHVSNALRDKSGSDADGATLVGHALGGNPPKIMITKLQTESEKNVQIGFQHILRGMYQGIRNPRSHDQITDDKESADAIILFTNYILGLIDAAEEKFTLPKFLDRVLDPDFVKSDRYAEILVEEIPQKKVHDTLVELYRKKQDCDIYVLKLVIQKMLKRLTPEQITSFASVVSNELKLTRNEDNIIATLGLLPVELWIQLDEAAQLRAEHKIITSLSEGQISCFTGELMAGALATWAPNFAIHFRLRNKLLQTLLQSLRAEDEDYVAYALKYYGADIPRLVAAESKKATRYIYPDKSHFITALADCAKSDSKIIRAQLVEIWWSLPESWSRSILELVSELKESDPEFYKELEEADLPF